MTERSPSNVLEFTRGWVYGYATCKACRYRFMAVRPVETDDTKLECSRCGAQDSQAEERNPELNAP